MIRRTTKMPAEQSEETFGRLLVAFKYAEEASELEFARCGIDPVPPHSQLVKLASRMGPRERLK